MVLQSSKSAQVLQNYLAALPKFICCPLEEISTYAQSFMRVPEGLVQPLRFYFTSIRNPSLPHSNKFNRFSTVSLSRQGFSNGGGGNFVFRILLKM